MLVKINCAVLLILLLFLGFRLADQKPLWNDEIYSQISSIENLSYSQILAGKISEGNISPFFYLTQKVICQLAGYRSPDEWQAGASVWGSFDRPVDRRVLRVGPVGMTALAVALIFYFFLRFYSWPTAVFSLFLSLSSIMLWRYWAEARPYSAWMLLTTCQTLLFLAIVQFRENKKPLLAALAAVHVLLSLSVVLSLGQIALVCGLLWLYGQRELKSYVFLLLVPALICLSYYSLSPRYPFGLIFTVEQYIRANISRDKLYLFVLFGLVAGFSVLQERLRLNWLNERIKSALPVFGLGLGMVAVALTLLLMFKVRQAEYVQFPVTEKYLIFLTPVGIIVSTVFADALVRGARNRWVSLLFAVGIAALTVPRFLRVMKEISDQYPGLF